MSTAALRKSEAGTGTRSGRTPGGGQPLNLPWAVRFVDLVVLALALPIFVLADLPLTGYGAAAGAWIVQRAIQAQLKRRAAGSDDPRTIVGYAVAGMIARGWLVALAIFGAGLAGGDKAGLTAAILVLALFTLYLSLQLILHPLETAQKGSR